MNKALDKDQVALLEKVVSVLYEWSGVSDDTPDDTEIIADSFNAITFGDLRDVMTIINMSK